MRERVSDHVRITTADTHEIYSGPCILERVTVNQTAAGTAILYTGVGSTVGTLASSPPVGTYEYGCLCAGVTVVTSAGIDMTVVITPFGNPTGVVVVPPGSGDALLMESGSFFLLEIGDRILLE